MGRIPVYMRDLSDAKHIVQIAGECRSNANLVCGRYVVNAKSMLGVFALPTFGQVEMEVSDEDKERVKPKLEVFGLIRK
ncbi:HPr family phosphocarrier protein [uncultured Catenibacterium sp.]|uniref:HPr family phosphocarrier protein n=1 Tax=uncultured Catenibacterium sp. TaxID=286142 RepID=UPI0025CF7E04|nr:HPr family phosphocarrier protein [uncultured Catenibacterium sp.]